MKTLHREVVRAWSLAGSLGVAALLAAVPVAALAQAAGADDPVGKPFPLWVFLVPVAGIIALVGAYMAKGAVEKPGNR